ncbi:MAG: oligopeptidase B, partial [Calditrichaeota bacterium]
MKAKSICIISYRFLLFSLLLLQNAFIGCSGQHRSALDAAPPQAQKIEQVLTIHGDARIDNYFWLRERENPQVIAYLTAENAYKDAVLQKSGKLQKQLYKEIVGRIEQTDVSVPYKDNGYYYYTRYEKGGEHPIYCRKKESLDAVEEIMLNVNDMARGHDFYHGVGLEVSEDNKFLAFAVDTVSRRKYSLHFKNLETGEILADNIPNTSGSAAWANDNQTVFYVTKDSTLRPDKVFRHV